MFVKCDAKTIKKSGFCEHHLPKINEMREIMSKELRVRCPARHEECHRIVRYRAQQCQHHRSAKVTVESTATVPLPTPTDIRRLLYHHLFPIVSAGIDYYVGIALDLDRRLSIHRQDHKDEIAKENEFEIILIPLMECPGTDQAALLEKMAIAECILNENYEIRSKLLNQCKYFF